jgi:hypothetical protein
MTWQLVAAANLAAGVAYGAIGSVIAARLARIARWRANPLGLATAAIFLTGAVHHGGLAVQMLLPEVGLHEAHGFALREAWSPFMVIWDGITAAVGVAYLAVRGSYPGARRDAQMVYDLKLRERQAMEINDNIVQGLTVAKYALSMGADEQSRQAIEETLRHARGIITDLLGEPGATIAVAPGDLRRDRAADVSGPSSPSDGGA